MLRSKINVGFPSGVFDSAVLLAQVNLLLQRGDSAG
jgi:hypothetical protein